MPHHAINGTPHYLQVRSNTDFRVQRLVNEVVQHNRSRYVTGESSKMYYSRQFSDWPMCDIKMYYIF
jgi:hypothetical protein